MVLSSVEGASDMLKDRHSFKKLGQNINGKALEGW